MKLLVIGSGAIGIEFASFYNDMGAEVTVVEMLDRIMPVEDVVRVRTGEHGEHTTDTDGFVPDGFTRTLGVDPARTLTAVVMP